MKETVNLPPKENVWVFIMAGQSNMAGRGQVEPGDTIPNERIFSINAAGKVIQAKEPLHFYEPTLTGLDCGLSFANTLLPHIPEHLSILLIPTAVGGSSVSQWLGDSVHRDVKLLTNFREKVAIGKKQGTIKGILWHQGESDAHEQDIPLYKERLTTLFRIFRSTVENETLPIIMGELGAFTENREETNRINQIMHDIAATDKQTGIIATGDLKDKGDHLHFNADGQRKMGQRYAKIYLEKFKY